MLPQTLPIDIKLVLAAVDPIKVGFFFVGLSMTSFVFGGKFLYLGWCGLRDGQYPLSDTKLLKGFAGYLAASVIFLFGLITFCCGLAAAYFGYFRMKQLL